jgi:hypothetical protein
VVVARVGIISGLGVPGVRDPNPSSPGLCNAADMARLLLLAVESVLIAKWSSYLSKKGDDGKKDEAQVGEKESAAGRRGRTCEGPWLSRDETRKDRGEMTANWA